MKTKLFRNPSAPAQHGDGEAAIRKNRHPGRLPFVFPLQQSVQHCLPFAFFPATMIHHSSQPKTPALSTRPKRLSLFVRFALGFSAWLVLPIQVSNATASADSGGEKKVEWYNKKVQIPKTGNTQVSARLASFYQYFHQNFNGYANDDQYSALVNRLSVKSATRLKKGRAFSVSARIDTQNMWENNRKGRLGHLCQSEGKDGLVTPKSKALCHYGNDYRLERFAFEFSSRKFSFVLGDFNVNLGRAMGLSIRRLDQIGVDSAIKGVKFQHKHKRIETKILGGFANRQNSDFAVRRRMKDPGYLAHYCKNKGWNKADRYGNSLWSICSDFVAGGRVEIKKLPGKIKLGLHHASIFFGRSETADVAREDSEETSGGKRLHLTGMDITPARIGGVWDTFLGGAVAIARHPGSIIEGFRSYNGIAAYNSNNISLGQFNALIEAKYYNDYLIALDDHPMGLQYAELATLERFDQWLPGAASTAGGRVRLDYFVGETGLDLYANGMAYAFDAIPFKDPHGTFSEEGGALAVHGFGGMEYHMHGSPFTLNIAVGYRTETYNKRDEVTGKRKNRRSLPHLDVFAKIPLSNKGRFSHTLSITNNSWYESYSSGATAEKFWRGTLTAEYAMAPIMTLSLMGGYTTRNAAPPGSLVLDKSNVCSKQEAETGEGCSPQLYPGFAARFNFLGRSYFQTFVGKRLGGLVCVNGSCRVLPDFVGAEAQLVLSF